MGIKIGFQALLLISFAVIRSSQEDVPNEHLLVLSSNTDGMAVVFAAGRDREESYDHANYLFTSGKQVSPACTASPRSSRCQKLLILSSGHQTYIVLAPLQDAVGLMELRYDGRALMKVRDSTLSITDEFLNNNCVPLDIVRFEGRLIVLCLEDLQTLRSCDIIVNHTDIAQSILKHCYLLHNFGSSITEADYQSISNFVSYPSVQTELVFILRGNIYGIRYESFNAHFFTSLNDVSCDRLQYAGDDIFYVYCASGQTFVYNTDTSLVDNASLLIPFKCPQSDETLFKVRPTAQDTIVRYNDRNYRTSGRNFTTGECYDTDTFFLVDSVEGTKAFRQSSASFRIISNSSRDRNILVFDGPYSVVYRTTPTEVALYDPSFQYTVDLLTVTAAHAVGVIPDLRVRLQTSSTLPTTMPAPTTPPTKKPPKNAVWYASGPGLTLWVVLGMVILILILILVPVTVAFFVRYFRKSKRVRNYEMNPGMPLGDPEGCQRNTPVGHAGSDRQGSDGSSSDADDDHSVAGTRDSLMDGRSGDEDSDDDDLVRPTAETQDVITNTDLVSGGLS